MQLKTFIFIALLCSNVVQAVNVTEIVGINETVTGSSQTNWGPSYIVCGDNYTTTRNIDSPVTLRFAIDANPANRYQAIYRWNGSVWKNVLLTTNNSFGDYSAGYTWYGSTTFEYFEEIPVGSIIRFCSWGNVARNGSMTGRTTYVTGISYSVPLPDLSSFSTEAENSEFLMYLNYSYFIAPPTYSQNSTSRTSAGSTSSHNLLWNVSTEEVAMANYVFSWNGSIRNDLPGEAMTYYVNETTTQFNVSGATYANGLGLLFPTQVGEQYLVLGYAETNFNSTSLYTYARALREGGIRYRYYDMVGIVNTETQPFTFVDYLQGDGNIRNYTWQFAASTASGKVMVNKQRLMAIRIDNVIGTGDFNYTYDATATNNVDNITGDDAGDTYNISITVPTAGDYWIFGSAAIRSGSTSSSSMLRIAIDNGAEYIPYLAGSEAIWSYNRREDRGVSGSDGTYVTAIRNLSAGTHNISIQFADIDTTPSADWEYKYLMAIRLTDNFMYFKNSTTTQTSTTSTTYQNKTRLDIPAGNAGEYLVMGGISTRLDQTSYDFEEQVTVDGVRVGYREHRPRDVANIISNAIWGNLTLNDNAHTVLTQFRRQDTTGTVYVKNSDILALRIDRAVNTGYGWTNDTPVVFSSNWSNVTKTLPNSPGLSISWCVYGNDSVGNVNWTSCENPFTYTVTEAVADTCTWSGSGNWDITCSDACTLNSNVNMLRNNITFTGSGFITILANIFNWSMVTAQSGCTVTTQGATFG